MVTVDVTAVVPVIDAGWLAVQVGVSEVPAVFGVTAHVKATLPVNPLAGVMVTVEVVDAP
jgi:hypothetical protein